jgi:hypothetical protein
MNVKLVGKSTDTESVSELGSSLAARMRANLLARITQAIREKKFRSEEYESLMLQYRNLETSIRLGLL